MMSGEKKRTAFVDREEMLEKLEIIMSSMPPGTSAEEARSQVGCAVEGVTTVMLDDAAVIEFMELCEEYRQMRDLLIETEQELDQGDSEDQVFDGVLRRRIQEAIRQDLPAATPRQSARLPII